MAAEPISGAIGVTSTVANVISAGKQKRVARAQAANQRYAAEVNAMLQQQALSQQKTYADQQRNIANTVYKQQDAAARMSITAQEIEAGMQNLNADFQNNLQGAQADMQLQDQLRGLAKQGFNVNEQERNTKQGAQLESKQQNDQQAKLSADITAALEQGDKVKAQQLASAAVNGQSDSATSQLMSADTEQLVAGLREKAASGRMTQEDIQQLQYNDEIAGRIKDLGMSDVMAQIAAAVDSNEYAGKAIDLNKLNLGFTNQQNKLGSDLARGTLDASSAINQQQRNLDKTFSDLSFQNQASQARQGTGAQMMQYDSTGQQGGGNGLLSAVALGGSLFNAAQQARLLKIKGLTPQREQLEQ